MASPVVVSRTSNFKISGRTFVMNSVYVRMVIVFLRLYALLTHMAAREILLQFAKRMSIQLKFAVILGSTNTVSMVWMIPLVAILSVQMTLASLFRQIIFGFSPDAESVPTAMSTCTLPPWTDNTASFFRSLESTLPDTTW